MTRSITKAELEQSLELASPPQLTPNLRQDIEQRNFGLPVRLHATYFGLFLAFLGVMAFGMQTPHLIIPIAVCVWFTTAFYVVPMLWTKVGPQTGTKAMSMGELERKGIMTYTGWCSGRDAAIQMLILPGLVFMWGVATVTIAAFTF